MSTPSREVPKFSSFRAKKPVSQEQSSPSLSTSLKRRPSDEHHHRSIKPHSTSAHREPSSRRHPSPSEYQHKAPAPHSRDRRHEARELPAIKNQLLTPHDGNPDLFVADRKGDHQNVAYERLHKYSIPPYHRIGYGYILGLDLRFRIDRAESTIDKVFIADKSATAKQGPQRMLLKRQRNQELPALHVANEHELDLAQDFVVLSSSADSHDSGSLNDDYDSFKYLNQSDNPDSHESRQQVSGVAPAADLRIRQQNVQFVRATKSNPSDLQAWLDLAKHQEYLVSPGADARSLTNAERQALADMRISVYEKAMKHFPQSESSERERLVLELLREVSLAWNAQKYTQKLQEILQQHPKSFSVWTQYLDACQTNPIDFRFEDVKAFFMRSLRTLCSSASSNHEPETKSMMLYLVLRYTVFLLDTGYDELSIATWQALCEYHLFRPEHLAAHKNSQVLAEFEKFWEDERPRFGEVGARGWCATFKSDDIAPDFQESPPTERLSSNLPFKSFSILERTMNEFLQFPGRTMDETGADDPFHVVFFSDIQDVLEATAAGLDHYDLLDAILCYLGLPGTSSIATTGRDARPQPKWRSDNFLYHGLLQVNFAVSSDNKFSGQRMQHYQMSTELLFSRAFEGLSLPVTALSDGDTSNQRSTQGVTRFVQRILSNMVKRFPNDDNLAEYYLAFELSLFPKEASKIAKNILKQRPSSLRLYNACAIIEAKLGKVEKAAQIWSGAINMKDSFSRAAQEELVLLWRGWIWCYLEANQPQRALSRLASFGSSANLDGSESTSMSTATLLRLRNAFKDGFEHSLSQSHPHLAALNVEVLALVAYLTQTDPLHASVDAVHEQCTVAQQRSTNNHVLLEMLHQVKAGIIAYHIRQRRPYRPAFVRFELETSIALYPNNTLFLEMYRDNEVRFRLDDRVRSILKSQVLTHDQSPLVTWTFAIKQELLRYTSQTSGSTAESVRSTFNRALMTIGSPVRYSQMLWVMWFQFEKQAAMEEAVKASAVGKGSVANWDPFKKLKQVFLSGLHHLPWSKFWILLGLETFNRDDERGWKRQDLRRLYNVLVERELRIRVDGLESLLSLQTNDG